MTASGSHTASPSPIEDAGTSLLHSVFRGESEMAARGRDMDWSATPLGPVDQWPMQLRTAVRMAMECPFPINLWCGPELILIYNDGYRELLGIKHPGALGRRGQEVWHEIWDEIAPLFARIREGGASAYAENARFAMERRSGPAADAWFTYSVSAIRNDAGDLIAILNVASETTGRVLAERQLIQARAEAEHAERRLRDVFSQAPAFLAVLTGPEHRFEFVNAAYLQLVGHRQVVGLTVNEAIPEVRDQGFIALLDQVYATGKPFIGREVPVMLQREPGAAAEMRVVDLVYQSFTDPDGSSSGIVAHGTDVTEAVLARREVERLLQVSEQMRADAEASEARYRFLANAIPVQVWTAAPDGRLDYVSDPTAEYFGTTPDVVVGEGWLAMLHADDVQPTIARWTRSLQTGEPYEMEFRLRSASGEYRWHLARATAQRDEQGAIIRWVGTNTDIEDWKRAEAELKRLTAEATEANRAKGDFLAAMSHELRTPLNAIGGYAQLIELGVRGPVTEEQRIDLLKIQRSKNHLDALVSDVLNFAKAGAGKIEYRVSSLELRKLLDSVFEMIAPQLREKQLYLAPPAEIPAITLVADPDKARQILLNLFANALKFTPANGTITVTVGVFANEVAITVRDTGIGIDASQLERIFEPFAQADRALHTTDQGVGLGLAISRQLARAMGGDITVESTVGHGSAFTVTIPRQH